MDLGTAGESPWGGTTHLRCPLEVFYMLTSRARCAFKVTSTGAFGLCRSRHVQCVRLAKVPLFQNTVRSSHLPENTGDPGSSAAASSVSLVTKSSAGRGHRTPRKVEAQATQLEPVDDSLGPLGPLGDNSEPPQATPSDDRPTPPYKETSTTRTLPDRSTPSQSSVSRGVLDSVELDDDGEFPVRARKPPPVHPPVSPAVPHRQTQPSVPIEQAAKPTFEIAVGDPHKVGDLTSSHIVYQVRTKVRKLRLLNVAKLLMNCSRFSADNLQSIQAA